MYLINDDKQHSQKIAVIIPAFNEELTIGSMVLRIKDITPDVIVVDDGSTDGTSSVAKKAGAKVITLNENHGKTYAVKRGFDEVIGKGYSVAVMIDADGQHSPDDIQALVEPVLSGEADLVIGSRFMGKNCTIPSYRRFGQKVLNVFTNIGSKQKTTDSQSGFRALSMKAASNLNFGSDGYSLESGMIVHFASLGLTIKEVPIGVSYDVPNKHKKNPVSMGFGVMNYLITMVSLRRPLMFIGVPGLVITLLGLTLGLSSIMDTYILGWSWVFQSILAGFLLTVGMIAMISGLTLNSISHIVHSSSAGRHVRITSPRSGG